MCECGCETLHAADSLQCTCIGSSMLPLYLLACEMRKNFPNTMDYIAHGPRPKKDK